MFDLPKFGRGPSLARVDALLDACGVDREGLASRAIVVTGSNGKGSACAFLTRVAMAAGLRVGTFTSPHLRRPNERLCVNAREIEDEALRSLVAEVSARVATLEARLGEGSVGAFEAQLVAAALWFQREGAELVALEAGIGGRLDPTRLARASVSALTSVDLEHTELLGATRELIALDKADACAPGGVTVHGEGLDDLRELLSANARLRSVDARFVGRDARVLDARDDGAGLGFTLETPWGRHEGLRSALHGRYQASNAACAAVAFGAWLERSGRGLHPRDYDRALREGLAAATWPGRLEVVSQEPLTVVDVGHTPDAVARAADGLFEAFGRERWLLVTGVSVDKRAEAIVAALKPRFSRVVCTQAHHKGRDAGELAAMLRDAPGEAELFVEPALEGAARLAARLARSQGLRVFVVGGLFLAVEFLELARGRDPRALAFL
ncbi:MAG: hypothetical protein R3A48_04925 [Polyangiales bacterium]